MKFSTADWLAAIFFVALLLLPLWLPHAPMFVQVTIAHSRHLGRSLFCGLRLAQPLAFVEEHSAVSRLLSKLCCCCHRYHSCVRSAGLCHRKVVFHMKKLMPHHALQRSRASRPGCNPRVSWAAVAELGSFGDLQFN